jgi:uncharacterized membrane protein YdjX (TVP38/TMEM64 family)
MHNWSWSKKLIRGVSVVILLIGTYYFLTHTSDAKLYQVIADHKILGACLFGAVMFGTTVLAPLTSLPLIPMVAPLLGPFLTGTACFIGWTLGAITAFCIGRFYGRSVITRFVSEQSLQKYEAYLKPDTRFLLIVALRMIAPVDVISYALGIFTAVSFRIYVSATMVGIFWFSYAFAYGSVAFMNRDYVLLVGIGVASVVILGISGVYARRRLKGVS